ncbi:flavodoxin family protein [Georgenia satyanarayanai]|uniref:flavodoxin family protein n=1 Tax=Georgenia satyanarayanai TaxID=860221 RepID=UPI0012649AA1|nr:flavodoxin domain-containing protein [Georgenia satyanarayanai]
MDAVIVYESMWGNTKAVAEAIAAGLSPHLQVEALEVGSAPSASSLDVALLVVGGPTHAFGMSRPQTREDAARRGGHPGGTGIREWIESAGDGLSLSVAAFDTHARHPNLPGAASKKAAKALRRAGCTLVAQPESFYVEGQEGPLLPGELDRARTWGEHLAGLLPESSRV